MDTLLRLNADELNTSLVDFIKTTFKSRKIAVHIYEEEVMDETDYILHDPIARERILNAVENVNKRINLKTYTTQELNKYMNNLLNLQLEK